MSYCHYKKNVQRRNLWTKFLLLIYQTNHILPNRAVPEYGYLVKLNISRPPRQMFENHANKYTEMSVTDGAFSNHVHPKFYVTLL